MGIKFAKFGLLFFVGGGLLYAVQNFFLGHGENAFLLNFSYGFNFIISIQLLALLYFIRHGAKDQLGFIFLVIGFLKIGAFLLCLKYLDIELEKSSFLVFFIPYGYCSIIEVWLCTKILKAINY